MALHIFLLEWRHDLSNEPFDQFIGHLGRQMLFPKSGGYKMSVKFEIADWRFELSLKELVCQPIEVETKGAKKPEWKETPVELADRDLLTDCYGREQGLIL